MGARPPPDHDETSPVAFWALDSIQRLALEALGADCAVAIVTHGDPAIGWIAPTLRDQPQDGLPSQGDLCPIPIAGTFCGLPGAESGPVAIADADTAARGCRCTLMRAERMRAYLSVPVRGAEKGDFGRLCVMTRMPRIWSRQDRAMLGALAVAMAEVLPLRDVTPVAATP